MDSVGKKDSEKMVADTPEIRLNNAQLVPESSSVFAQPSTSFDAYPLESSSDFLNNENGVVFMPLTPTDLPLSFQNRHIKIQRSPELLDQTAQQPVCHGFFFPYTSNENATGASFNTPVTYPESHATTNIPAHNEEQQFTERNTEIGLHQTAENELQLLLLQKLIAIQLANHLSSVGQNRHDVDDSVLPYNPPLEVPPTFPLDNVSDIPLTHLEQNMSTYLIPVEATLHDSRGLALHVTPRSDLPEANCSPGFKMECSTDQLVLYPYPTKQTLVNNEETPPVTASVDGQQMPPAQALTINDIKNCIRRGSLELPLDGNTEIVNSIKGHKKPGFVLLSIRHEKLVTDENGIAHTTPQKSLGVNFDIPTFRHSVARASTPPATQSSRRANKRRQRLLRADTEPQRRSIKKTPRLNSKVVDESHQSTEINVEQTTLATKSRFRVSRFADKKQVWLAPSGTGCFTVHDLWTTKLPDYVLKKIEQIEKGVDTQDFSSTEMGTADDGAISNTCCAVCQSTQPKPCECGVEMPAQTVH